MKSTSILIAFAATLTMCQNVFSQTGIEVPELVNFDAAMENLIDQYDVPGAQLAITYQGRLVYSRGFGFANSEQNLLVQPNSKFRLASVSKPITALGMMKLLEDGQINLDDHVFGTGGILENAGYDDMLDSRVLDITVQQLLEHSGGWNRDISGDPMFNSYAIATAMGVTPPADPETVIRYVLQNNYLDFDPGTEYQYSNLGYCILGRIIEEVTGQSYEAYMEENIFVPAGVTNGFLLGNNLQEDALEYEVTYYNFPGSPLAYSVYDNTTLVPWTYGGFNIEAMDAHGGWISSAEDLCRLLVAVDMFDTSPDILSQSSIQTMITPSENNDYYALGWAVNPFNNWWHMGSLPGTTTEIVRAGNQQLNWALLLNTRNANSDPLNTAVDALVWNVLPTISTWPEHDLFLDIEEGLEFHELKIFPNPTSQLLNIQFEKFQNNAQIVIADIAGRKVKQVNGVNGMIYQLELSDIPSGNYQVIITSEDQKTKTSKLIVQD